MAARWLSIVAGVAGVSGRRMASLAMMPSVAKRSGRRLTVARQRLGIGRTISAVTRIAATPSLDPVLDALRPISKSLAVERTPAALGGPARFS